jgi:hypothetical protein
MNTTNTQLQPGTARLVKCQTNTSKQWIVEWMHGDLYQVTEPLTRWDGKKFIQLLSFTLPGPFFHQVKNGSLQDFPVSIA